ncbi:MAG: sigma 54-interacting transcriptional regulator [Myxococcota bacterium]|nr:sigma 54-interacting transcriptional regulator [Myxococcota bacterium]
MSDFRSTSGASSPGGAGHASPAGTTGIKASAPEESASGAQRAAGAAHATASKRSQRIILASAATQEAVDQASAIARTSTAVLIEGQTGTGRRHLARAIHGWSQRASGPLVGVAAAGIAEPLQARELFGATAESDPLGTGGSQGALDGAASGTLLIEQIDRLAPGIQARLTAALRNGSFSPDGSNEARPVKARIIATCSSAAELGLDPAAAQRIQLAPLSQRKEDVLPLAAHFLAELAEEGGVTAVGFTVDARRWLVEEPWTGNIRELRERIRQALVLAGTGSISAEALMLASEGEEVPSFKEAKRAFETRYVESLLRRCAGNISRAARLAKKDRKDFYDVIRRTGVDPTQFRH